MIFRMMCIGCGHFVHAKETDNGVSPLVNSCPECGGGKFKKTDSQ